MGTHLRVLGESYLMNTNMMRFGWFLKIFVLWTKVALALEGLSSNIFPKKYCRGIEGPSIVYPVISNYSLHLTVIALKLIQFSVSFIMPLDFYHVCGIYENSKA